MAKYTTQIKTMLDNGFELALSDYPIFDESYRPVLNKKIKDRYLFREIGLETPALFNHFLSMRMNEIMPYYNQLYESTLLEIKPLINYEMTESNKHIHTGKTIGKGQAASQGLTKSKSESNSETSAADDRLSVGSDTPQGLLSIPDIKSNVYASNATREDNNTSATGKDSATAENDSATYGQTENETDTETTDEYIKTMTGSIGVLTHQKMLEQWRETFINVDVMIIDELGDLFMGLY